jgi:hypothetical protein
LLVVEEEEMFLKVVAVEALEDFVIIYLERVLEDLHQLLNHHIQYL